MKKYTRFLSFVTSIVLFLEHVSLFFSSSPVLAVKSFMVRCGSSGSGKNHYLLILSFVVTGLFLLPSLNLSPLFASEDNEAGSSKSFVMASIVSENTPEGKWLYLTYNEAFRRVGLKLDYRYYPSMSASDLADRHKVEGELARSYYYGQSHPDLIRVEEPGISNLTIALTTHPEIRLDDWESFRGTSYKVLFLRGTERTPNKLAAVVKPELLSSVSDWSQGFEKLLQGEADVFVVPEIIARRFSNKEEFQDNIIHSAGIIDVITIHAYLHKTHALLGSQLSEALKEMKKEGLINRYKINAGVDQ